MKNARPLDSELFSIFNPGRQKLCKGTKTPKSLDPDKNFKLFCGNKNICRDLFYKHKSYFFRCNFGKIANSRLTTELKHLPKACQLLPPCLEIGQDTIIFDFWTIIWCKCWSSELLVLLLVTDCES